MTPEENGTVDAAAGTDLVVRSEVPPGREYVNYKRWLRQDFFYSCAYCTMSEAEAQAIRFVIDHYEPVSARPDLKDVYDNLMYCCDECNVRKGDRCPPPSARSNGFRFFRPDEDRYEDHFKLKSQRLESLSNVGEFSIHALDLNRALLRRLRELRDRATQCHHLISQGARALRSYPIDRLPQHVKASAVRYIARAIHTSNELENAVDEILRNYAKSSLLEDEPDPDAGAESKERLARLRKMQALYPGVWRTPRNRQG